MLAEREDIGWQASTRKARVAACGRMLASKMSRKTQLGNTTSNGVGLEMRSSTTSAWVSPATYHGNGYWIQVLSRRWPRLSQRVDAAWREVMCSSRRP